jgi:hypothetical protein
MTNLKFNLRPSPVLPEHRPLYKITQILHILDVSRGGKSSLLRLHLFNWALKSPARLALLDHAITTGMLAFPTWGFDPAMVIALRFAVAEGLVQSVTNGYQLEDKGRRFLKEAFKDPEIFTAERKALRNVGKGITEKMVDAAAKNWE